MASRTKQKEEARARRLAEEQARAARARQQQRIRLIGGTVLAAVVIVVALVLINSGSKKGGIQTGTNANATVSLVDCFAGQGFRHNDEPAINMRQPIAALAELLDD